MKFSHAQVAELSKEQGTATKQQPVEKLNMGGLSTAQWTVRLSAASVEMTNLRKTRLQGR